MIELGSRLGLRLGSRLGPRLDLAGVRVEVKARCRFKVNACNGKVWFKAQSQAGIGLSL